jgi:glycosyltransferase involved in cell wall biosynthesis
MPLVSVIIPTYNRATLLPRAVESVLSQTFRDFECIIVDDCSDDGMNTHGSVTTAGPALRYVRLPAHCGVSTARNTGVGHSCGQWLAFLDSDDEWHPEKLERQIAWLSRNPGIRIFQTKEFWIRHGKRVNPPKTHEKPEGYIFEQSLKRCMITPSSVMIERGLFSETGGFNESLRACEDYDLWLRITCRQPVGLVKEYLLTRYGGHADQLSSAVMGLDRFRIRSLLDLLAGALLTPQQELLVKKELVKKATIVANGFLKRGNTVCHERYKRIAEQYSD